MRRALSGIVPAEVLFRKRKAYVARASMVAISAEWAAVAEMTKNMDSSSLGIVDEKRLSAILEKARHGDEVQMTTVIRTLGVESWLKNLRAWRVTDDVSPENREPMRRTQLRQETTRPVSL